MNSGIVTCEDTDWAGTPFIPLYYRDARFFRCSGLYGWVRRALSGERTLLYIDHADLISSAMIAHPLWTDALRLGVNELHINLRAESRVDRLILRQHIIKRCGPILNLLNDDSLADAASPWHGSRKTKSGS